MAGEKRVLDVLKDAYERGSIDKEEYENTVHKLIKREVEGKSKEEFISEFKVIEKDGKPEIILEEGELDVPLGSSVEIKKEDNEISILRRKDETAPTEMAGQEIAISDEIGKVEETPKESEKEEISFTEDIENIEREFQSINWTEREKRAEIVSGIKEEVELIDLKREFQIEEEPEEEEESEEEEEESGSGLFKEISQRVNNLLKGVKEESKEEKLKRLSLKNLSKIKEIKEERRAIVGVAYVLKQFLEIRFEIPHELTYRELIEEIKGKDIEKELKNSLLDFFKRLSIRMYARLPDKERFSEAYNLADKTINELSKK